jgi:hypothetical protein
MTNKIDMSQEKNPEWFQWWIDPAVNDKPAPDPEDLQSTLLYIESNYTPETQEKITIHVRDKKFDDSWD